MRRLTRDDVPSDTIACARFLVGTVLVRSTPVGIASGRIVETEAYLPDDPASHAFRGMTQRNRAMFGQPLLAYVYFIYGTAYCLNVSTESEGVGAAVLIRALQPTSGLELMRARRGERIADRDLLRGPGRTCIALDIDRRLDGADLATDDRIWLADDDEERPLLGVSTRVGLTKAVDVPLRFFAAGSQFVSGRRSIRGGPAAGRQDAGST